MRQKDAFDMVVVGSGIIGGATAWHSAKSGLHTLLLEQYCIGHKKGSSHGSSREFGETHTDRIDRKLARRSRILWRELEIESGQELLSLTGGIEIGTGVVGRNSIEEIVSTLRSERQPCEILDSSALRRRYSQWRRCSNVSALYSPHTGVLWADRCLRAVAHVAKKYGALVREHTRVTSVVLGRSGTMVIGTASGETYRAKRLVIAAGPWAQGFLKRLGVVLPLRISQVQTVYFVPRNHPELFTPEHFPIWTWEGIEYVYGFPMLEKPGVKIAFHTDGRYLANPCDYTQVPSQRVTVRLRSFLAAHIPAAAGKAFDAATCLYTETPDNDFIIDRVPGLAHTAYFAGCSGHAFHCAPAIAESLMGLVRGGKTAIDISRFSAKRFSSY